MCSFQGTQCTRLHNSNVRERQARIYIFDPRPAGAGTPTARKIAISLKPLTSHHMLSEFTSYYPHLITSPMTGNLRTMPVPEVPAKLRRTHKNNIDVNSLTPKKIKASGLKELTLKSGRQENRPQEKYQFARDSTASSSSSSELHPHVVGVYLFGSRYEETQC